MALPLPRTYAPMDARLVSDLPHGDQWQYEPKWDGFRCPAFRDGEKIDLESKSGQPLGRYFPEVVEALHELSAKKFVIDSELVVPVGDALSNARWPRSARRRPSRRYGCWHIGPAEQQAKREFHANHCIAPA